MVKILFENKSNFFNLFRKVLIKRDTIDNKVDKKVQDIIHKKFMKLCPRANIQHIVKIKAKN